MTMIYALEVTDHDREYQIRYNNDGVIVLADTTDNCIVRIEIPKHILEKFIEMIK
jgi:hypothetical protein